MTKQCHVDTSLHLLLRLKLPAGDIKRLAFTYDPPGSARDPGSYSDRTFPAVFVPLDLPQDGNDESQEDDESGIVKESEKVDEDDGGCNTNHYY